MLIPRHSCLLISFLIFVFSVSINIHKFMEYTTQIVTKEYAEGVFVHGARREGLEKSDDEQDKSEHNETKNVTWVWVIVRPTPLRLSSTYSKVSLTNQTLQRKSSGLLCIKIEC